VLKGCTDNAQEAVRDNFEAALAVLRDVATVEEVELPDLPHQAVARIIIAAEASAAFDDFIAAGESEQLTAEADKVGGYVYEAVTARDYLRALRIRRQICRAMDALFTNGGAAFDALAAPTLTSVAPPADASFARAPWRGGVQIGAAGNVAGLPAISVPNGFG